MAVAAGTRPAFLPSEVDPTVFDEAFLRQLERLAAAHALAGPRRAEGRPAERQARPVGRVRRLPRLRPRRRPAPARLERLRPPREALRQALRRGGGRHGHAPPRRVGVDGERARPRSSLFAKRAAAALGYIGLASEDRVAVSALAGRIARRRAALRGSGRVFRLLADLSAIEPADGPTDLVAAARHAAAQLHGRGVVILISDLLDPAADRVIRELAATGSELIVLHVLSPDELDPPLEGDLRLVDSETGERVDITADLATIDAYKARLAAWKARLRRPRRASAGRATSTCASDVNLADLMFAELRRRRVLG